MSDTPRAYPKDPQLARIERLLEELIEMLKRYMGEAAQGRGLGH